jgi:hypothetical protein
MNTITIKIDMISGVRLLFICCVLKIHQNLILILKKLSMKKTLLLSTLLISVSLFNAQAVKKMAYITDPAQATYANDTKILPMFKADANFTVTEITATTAGQDLTGYDLVVIAEPAGSAAPMVLACKGINKPVLNMKVFAYKTGTTTWAWVSANGNIVDNTTSQNVIVKKPNHSIFAGLNLTAGSTLQMVTTASGTKGINGITAYLTVVGTPDTLATVKDATTGLDAATGQLCIMEFPVGSSINGTTIPQKFIQIGVSGTSYANVTDAALTVIKNAAYYVAGLNLGTGVKNTSMTLGITQNSNTILVETAENLSLSIYSASGQHVCQSAGHSISIDNLNKGIYMLKMTDKNGSNQTYKFIR